MNQILEKTTSEISKSTGINELISALVELYFGDFTKHMRILRISRDSEVEIICKNLTDKLSSINPNNLNNPIGTIEEPILNTAFSQYSNCFTSKHYQELFNNLISSTFDKSKYHDLHPSFPFIISQLTPLDAKILLDINNRKQCCTFSLHYMYETNTSKHSDSFLDFYPILNENGEYEEIELTNISINNLVKQGLITLGKITPETNIEMQINDDKFSKLIQNTTNHPDSARGGRCGGSSSIITLTRLGLSFIRTCMSEQ